MVTVVGCCPEDISADEAPLNKLGDAFKNTFEVCIKDRVIEIEN